MGNGAKAIARLELVPAVAACLTATFTWLAVRLGPKPTGTSRAGLLNDPGVARVEVTDRAILVGWWLIAIAMAMAATWLVRSRRRSLSGRSRTLQAALLAVLCLGSMALILASVTSGTARGEPYPWAGLSPFQLLIGFSFALLTLWMWRLPRRRAVIFTLAVVGFTLLWAVPAFIQTPGSVADAYHFQFTSDEISAVGAGHFPLSNYVPQYSVLLGFPIAPVLHLLGVDAIFGVIGWLLLLQVVALIAAIALPALVGGWRMLAPATVVVLFPSLATLPPGGSPTDYFAVMPMRVVLPALTLLAAFLVLRNRHGLTSSRLGWVLSLGALAGVGMLNNPDYGLPAGLIVLVATTIACATMRDRAVASAILLGGMSVPFVAYTALGWSVGHPVHWSDWLFFQRVFGSEGYYSKPISSFGLHIAFVTLFVSALVVGVALMIGSRSGRGSFAYRQGLLLTLVGGGASSHFPTSPVDH